MHLSANTPDPCTKGRSPKRPYDLLTAVITLALFFVAAPSILAGDYKVDTTVDDSALTACTLAPNDCSLRGAITTANMSVGADTIYLPPGTYTLTITSTNEDSNVNGDLDIINGSSITLVGLQPRRCIIEAGTIGGPSGNGIDRVFDIMAGGTLSADHVTIRNGRAPTAGGGIRNAGNLSVIRSTIADNRTTVSGGGGIEILTGTNTTVLHSTISGNSVGSSSGGAIRTIGNAQVFIANTTLSGNTAAQTGGGAIRAQSGAGGLITITNCTITGNTLLTNAGGGLSNSNTMRVRNTIISGNTALTNPDVSSGFSSEGTNLIGVQGTSTGWIASDLVNNTAANLGPLQNNGGPVDTHFLTSTSSALNAGQACVVDSTCTVFNAPLNLAADGRGAARLGNTDIGAFEQNAAFVATLSEGVVNMPYNETLSVETGSFFYCLSSGSLPPGIMGINGCLNAKDGDSAAPSAALELTGTPTMTGVYDFVIRGNSMGNDSLINHRIVVNMVPTSAPASISGRALTRDGRGITNAVVILTDQLGDVRFARTGSLGYYRFDDVSTGQTYVMGASSKRYEFVPRVFQLADDLTDFDLVHE